MLLLGSRLQSTPIMSLQTGGRLGQTTQPIIDPKNLKIVAYEIDGPLLTERPTFVRTADIREYGRLGMIIDSTDELIGKNDVIQVDELYSLGFPLIGMVVVDDQKKKLGKVSDYTLETEGFVIQQLNIQRGFFKGFNDTGLLVHRSQIVEINDKEIVVRSTVIKSVEPVMQSVRSEFINPFRKPTQPEVESTQTIE